MKVWQLATGAAMALAISAGSAQAQAFGVQANYANDFDFGIGARLEYGLPNLITSSGKLANTFLIGSVDFFFPDCGGGDCSYMEGNLNLAVPVGASSLRPYAGAGLNYARISVDTGFGDASSSEIGVNVLGGLRFNLGGMSTFGEARYELGGGEQFVLTFGVLLGGS
jgi:opacity protein-like surface antigen